MNKALQLDVHLRMDSKIVVDPGMIQKMQWIETLWERSHKFVIVTDDHVRDLHGIGLQRRLKERGLTVELISIPPGEKSKTREWKEKIEDQMMQMRLGRDTTLIALGGGVVTDLGGFVAATYCRGIHFISIPTTLLGMVDASIGGKVAVNSPYGKNLIGAYYHPEQILIDRELLGTLPSCELRNGMAEVIKYGAIGSMSLIEKLESGLSMDEWLVDCCMQKQQVVQKDPNEKGLRRILNFGHTIGHAIEVLTEHEISHGEAVALGMHLEANLSVNLGYLSKEEHKRLRRLIQKTGFSLELPRGLSKEDLLQVMTLDKKSRRGQARFVLLEKVGQVHPFEGEYCRPVNSSCIAEVLK